MELWIDALGVQEGKEIDISSGDERWIITTVQQVDPGNNSVAKSKKYVHVREVIEALKSWRDGTQPRLSGSRYCLDW